MLNFTFGIVTILEIDELLSISTYIASKICEMILKNMQYSE